MPDRPVHPLTLLYGEAPPPTLHRDNTAVVVVDMQYASASRHEGLGRLLKDQGHSEQGAARFDLRQDASLVSGVQCSTLLPKNVSPNASPLRKSRNASIAFIDAS